MVTAMLLAAGMLAYWFATPAGTLLAQMGVRFERAGGLGLGVRLMGFAVCLIPLGVLIHGLFGARRCFRAFASGRIFSPEAVSGLRTLAIAVAVSTILKPLAGAALSMVLSGGPGGRVLSFNVGSDTLVALIFAGTVAVIAWVMAEAIEIADENAQFV
ncbi:DUF2975 domain-containing protein [Iodidimonas sp. SYSU 1G8]|uniref:DUF2975 domain-containing protein n=1 Tax=Iodidimonas sp. SYSU 1G8 TaxID=3133967 RepID=UPI0031FE7757